MGNFEFTLQVTYFLDIYVCLLFFGSLRLLLMLKSVKLLAFIPWGPWAATADFMKCRVTSLNLLKTSIRQMILAKLCNRFIWCLHLCTHYLNSECFFFFFFFFAREETYFQANHVYVSLVSMNCFVCEMSHNTAKQRLTWQEPLLNDVWMEYIGRSLGLILLTLWNIQTWRGDTSTDSWSLKMPVHSLNMYIFILLLYTKWNTAERQERELADCVGTKWKKNAKKQHFQKSQKTK